MPEYNSRFQFGDRVNIDGGDVVGTIVGVLFYAHGSQALVSWWSAGDLKEQWINDFRLTEMRQP